MISKHKIKKILSPINPKDRLRVKLSSFLRDKIKSFLYRFKSFSNTIENLIDLLIPGQWYPVPKFENEKYIYKSDLKLRFPVKMKNTMHIAAGYCNWLYNKYKFDDFVEIKKGDLVLESGGFVGGFTIPASLIAQEIHTFEPSPRNFKSLEKNCNEYQLRNVYLYKLGLFDKACELDFSISERAVDDGFYQPDFGTSLKLVKVKTIRIDDWALKKGITRIDFLKVEAEGAELEIVKSIGDLDVRKIAVDVSPERYGESDAEKIKLILEKKGYKVLLRKYMNMMLYARKIF